MEFPIETGRYLPSLPLAFALVGLLDHALCSRLGWRTACVIAAVPGLLASMDVAVAPYPVLEHFYFSPLKLFEYMAAGRACIASRIGQ